jgi:hypothetical protein
MIRLVSDAGASGQDFGALMEELVREGELGLLDPGAVDEVGALLALVGVCGGWLGWLVGLLGRLLGLVD